MSRYEMLAYFCIGGTTSMLLIGIHDLIVALCVRSELKSNVRRAKYRKYYKQKYWEKYVIHRNQEELFEEWINDIEIK